MLTAINIIKLILLVSLGLLFFIGQGWLVTGPLLHGHLIKRTKNIPYFQELSITLISGLIINYGVVLIFHSLRNSLLACTILAIIGLVCYSVMFIKDVKLKTFSWNSIIKIFGVLLTCVLFIGPVMFIPLYGTDWDARSIWFLHAKMVYYAGSFSLSSGWLHPSVYFSHPDYPNLVPTLAAQIPYVFGFWNEYLPKASLFFLIIPAIMMIFSFYRRSFSFLVLMILIPFSFSSKLWNGYMDGHLTLYFALSLLLLGRYIKNSKPIDLISSAFCLLILIYLKNEGLLAALSGTLAICLTVILMKIKISIRVLIKDYWKYLVGLLVILIPFGLWNLYKHQWGLTNDLAIGVSDTLKQFLTRITDGSYKLIIGNVHDQLNDGLMIFGFLLFGSLALKKRIPREIIPILFASLIYCLGIIAIYMITPYDLVWHLHTSVARTILTATVGLYVASFYLLINFENKEDKTFNSW